MNDYRFADPWWLLALIIPLIVIFRARKSGGPEFAPFHLAATLRPSRGPLLFRLIFGAALCCFIIALARPQFGRTITETNQEGRDLILVIDLSDSMQVDDIANTQGQRTDRLEAVIDAAKQFIAGRQADRIGLVFFAEHALTGCPLTSDHATVVQFLDRTEQHLREQWQRDSELLGKGTNLGLGLGVALKRLNNKDDRLGRAIILITDGRDTERLPNWVDPIVAARHAQELDIRVHGIGVGNPSGRMSVSDRFGTKRLQKIPHYLLPDIPRLRAITSRAGGEALTAGDDMGLQQVFARIDELEPTPRTIKTRAEYADRFWWFIIAGSLLMGCALTCEPRLRGGAA